MSFSSSSRLPGNLGTQSVFSSPVKSPPGYSRGTCTPYDELIAFVDSHAELKGARIVWVQEDGKKIEVRGGPRRRWVWITPLGFGPPARSGGAQVETVNDNHPLPTKDATPEFWNRWGDSVLSCGSAAATGVVIYLSGGVAGFWVGAFAANSALLCGTSVGKGIYYEEWQIFIQNGGDAYKAWLTIETFLNLVDLANGAVGAVKLLGGLKKAGKLARLSNAVKGKNITRANLLKMIQEIDPSFKANLSAKGSKYISKGKLITVGQNTLEKERFVSLINQRARVIADGVGNALTVGGAGSVRSSFKNTWDVWIVDYHQ